MRCATWVIVLCVVTALSESASAVSYGTAYIKYDSVYPSSGIEIWAGSYHYKHSGAAGVYNYLLNTDSPQTSWEGLGAAGNGIIKFQGFCSELGQYTNGWDTYNVVSVDESPLPGAYVGGGPGPMGLIKAAALSEFWGRFGPEVDAWSSWAGSQNTALGQAYAEAFQIGIWEIIFENPVNGYDVANGYLRVNPGTVDIVGGVVEINNWLSQIDGAGPLAELLAFTHDGHQDVITRVTAEMPEPATCLAVVLGFSCLAGYFRRRYRVTD